MNQRFDFIVAGGGASGLSLLVHLIQSGDFTDKKILLIEASPKDENDKTWCFWETKAGIFDDIVCKRWQKMWFHAEHFSKMYNIDPYYYKLIKSIDFYQYCFSLIANCPNITVRYGKITAMHSSDEDTYVIVEEDKISADYIFNSIIFDQPVLKKNEYLLLQHFKGWFIKTPRPVFNSDEATLMDFRVNQHGGTAFVYIMPFTAEEALVEYTVFSKEKLQPDEYRTGLKNYISDFLGLNDYTIIEEDGVIPMTNYVFPPVNHHIINIGTVGGNTKASSGYTFQFIQKHSRAIVKALQQSGKSFVDKNHRKRRFRFYDAILLNILSGHQLPGDTIFTRLFKDNSMNRMFKFLDNETSLMEEMNIIRNLPKKEFLAAAWKQL